MFFLAFSLQEFDLLQLCRTRALAKRRGLQQNVVLGWHFKEILVGHDGIRARVFFLAFFLQEFDLLPTLQNFRKRALGVPLANLT